MIPFNAKITGGGDQKNYADYLVKNAAPYILAWIIEGAKEAAGKHFRIPLPKCVEDAIAKYRQDNDWLSHFLEACCEIGDGMEEKSGEFYSAYRAYCARVGDFVRSTTEFYNAVEQRGFRREKRRSGRFVLGLSLAETADDF